MTALAFPGGLCELDSFRTDEAPTETTITPLPFQMLAEGPCSPLWEPREDCDACGNTGERTWYGGDDGPQYSQCSCLTDRDYPAGGLCFEDGCLGPSDACQHKPTDWDFGTGPTRGRTPEQQLRADLEESESLLLHLLERHRSGRWREPANQALFSVVSAINKLDESGFEDNPPLEMPR